MAAWPLVKNRKSGHTRIEKDRPTQKETSKPKKRSPDCFFIGFCFCFCFCFAPFLFHDLMASKLKKSQRQKKTGVWIRPSLAGYGLGTRIRATLARILIPGPATDPRLRIRSPGACLPGGDLRTDFGLLTDSFDLNFYLDKVCSLVGF